MIFDYWLAGLVTAGLLAYLTYALSGPRSSKRRPMTINGWIQIAIYFAILVALVVPLGWFMTAVFDGERTFLSPVLRPVEAASIALAASTRSGSRIGSPTRSPCCSSMSRVSACLYALACACRASCRSIQQGMTAVPEYLSFNTAISFVTNTNWQNYGGESTLSISMQMLGLTHQNFLSAATGIVLAVALIRGFARASAKTVGNFWVDLTRCTLYILIPICDLPML